MFQNLEIFQIATRMARHAGQRQALVAENMANSDTPGYLARDITPFEQVAQPRDAAVQRATRAGHLHGPLDGVREAKVFDDRSLASPNGNTVSVEREILKAVNTNRQHERAITIYKSSMDILRMSLGRQ